MSKKTTVKKDVNTPKKVEEALQEPTEELFSSCFPLKKVDLRKTKADTAENGTVLYGYMKNDKGQFVENPDTDFSAIVGVDLIMVTRSKHYICCQFYKNTSVGAAETEGPYKCCSFPANLIKDKALAKRVNS